MTSKDPRLKARYGHWSEFEVQLLHVFIFIGKIGVMLYGNFWYCDVYVWKRIYVEICQPKLWTLDIVLELSLEWILVQNGECFQEISVRQWGKQDKKGQETKQGCDCRLNLALTWSH